MRVLVVDDEPLARAGLRIRLEREADVAIVGEADSGLAAVEAIRTLAPDLVFLDVQMPDLDGFDVVREARPPRVVFVTAHEQHALRAFEVSALDYLLKPVDDARLQDALAKARRALAPDERLERLLAHLDARTFARRLVARDRDRFVLVPVEEIRYVAAAGNYAEIHDTAGRALLVRATLESLERRLDPAEFARIHRSTLVRLACARDLRPDAHGDFDLTLDDGTRLPVGRAYRDRLLR